MGFIEVVCDSNTAEYSTEPAGFYTSIDTPIFSLGGGIDKRVKGVKVTEVIIPYSWYNWWPALYYPRPYERGTAGFGESLLTFYLEDSAVPVSYTVDLPLPSYVGGNYTAAGWCAAVNTLINSTYFTTTLDLIDLVGPYTNTCTYNTQTMRMEISIVGSFVGGGSKIAFYVRNADGGTTPSNPTGKTLHGCMTGLEQGYNFFTQVGTGFTFISPYILNMAGCNNVVLHSDALGSLFNIQPNFYDASRSFFKTGVNGETNTLAVIPINAAVGENIVWKNEDRAGYFKVSTSNRITNFDLYLTLGPFPNKIRLNNQGFVVKLLLEVDDAELDMQSSEY
jgi:hypothetical protein